MFMRQTNHEVVRGGNLDLILRGFNGAINKLASELGNGLRAVALALSTPQDNSAQVQAEINKYTAEIKATVSALDAATRQQTKENDNG